MNVQNGTSRDIGIDLLKTVAIFGVIVIHTCSAGYYNTIPSFDWISSVFWDSIARASVLVFFMCSGALLLTPYRQVSLKKLYTRNLPHIVLAMFFWAMAYKLYELLLSGSFSLPDRLQALR